MRAFDPIFIAPRLVTRDWGRTDTGAWFGAGQSTEPLAEAWALDAANLTESGPLGLHVARHPTGVLGDVGRAPPKLRLVFPGRGSTIKSTSPLSFWTVMEPGAAAAPDGTTHRPGERIRAYEGAEVALAEGSVAVEVSSSFIGTNEPDPTPHLVRLPPVSKRMRATLFRDDWLSVETWSLPEWSRIVPDGETCHVILAIGTGIRCDGRDLKPGEAVLAPARGRPFDLVVARRDARVLVAYPARAPTSVWRHTPGPDPASGQLPKPAPQQPLLWAKANLHLPAEAA